MRPMGTDKPRISTVAQLAEKLARLELVPAEAPVPEQDPAEGPVLVPVDRVLAEAAERLPAARVAEPQRCQRTAALAQIASVIGLSHQAPGSVRVTTLLVEVGL